MNQCQDLIYPDYKYWCDVLQQLSCKKNTYSECAQHALKTFYRIIGQMLADKNRENNENIILVSKIFNINKICNRSRILFSMIDSLIFFFKYIFVSICVSRYYFQSYNI